MSTIIKHRINDTKIKRLDWSSNNGLKFNGSNSYVVGGITDLSAISSVYTLSCFIDVTQSTELQNIACSAYNAANRQIEWYHTNNLCYFRVGNISYLGLIIFPITYGYNHICVVKNGNPK